MADLVYFDETGSAGKGARRQPNLILAAVVVDEAAVRGLGDRMREIAVAHLGGGQTGFEWHGVEVWNGRGPWEGKTPAQLLAAYEELLGLLAELRIWVGHSTIQKEALRRKYDDSMVQDAYLLALQFLVEKVDAYQTAGGVKRRILIADEAKQHQVNATRMVTRMQEFGAGRVLGRWPSPLATVIDSIHFVDSARSAGVQLADMVAFILHRRELASQGHRTRMHPSGAWLR
ncbi:DUF3800 domain-containing protein [Tessaracoccus palaemonis]|uniref:DUF3800 domain-containing protein n=1 Tax=Tessaracoccus palaemonis TaxID=2829499 RepID=A0ABX8SKB2_9ACTN|nr:DUF3800 domain-containing protein [Tessaracoccus palaemonis]QXT63414.1 DUF3800 domain-containing protein [Tessaracoccus palaemonis]